MSSTIENLTKTQSNYEAYTQELEEENNQLRQQYETVRQQNDEKMEKVLAELKEAKNQSRS